MTIRVAAAATIRRTQFHREATTLRADTQQALLHTGLGVDDIRRLLVEWIVDHLEGR